MSHMHLIAGGVSTQVSRCLTTLMMVVSGNVHGTDERGCLLRRMLMRYAYLSSVPILCCIVCADASHAGVNRGSRSEASGHHPFK